MMEADIGKVLAKSLATTKGFPYWSFQQGSAAIVPRLSITLEQADPDWEVHMLMATPQGDNETTWKARLFAPGDLERLGGFPEPPKWPAAISAAFMKGFLDDKPLRNAILADLKEAVPLGQTIAPLGPQPPTSAVAARAILPLNWTKYCRLATSEFRVVYDWPQRGGEVTLYSKGVTASSPYNDSFQGIIVLHHDWEFGGSQEPIAQHLNDLPQLIPIVFYLQTPKEFTRPCTTPVTTSLSIAP